MTEGKCRWQVQASPARQLRALLPLLIGTAGACALVLAVLVLFSLGETTHAGLWFSLKLSALLLGAGWTLILLIGGAALALRGPLTLTYELDAEALRLEERTRRGHRRSWELRLAAVERVRRRRYGLALAGRNARMTVFCDANQAERIAQAAHKHA